MQARSAVSGLASDNMQARSAVSGLASDSLQARLVQHPQSVDPEAVAQQQLRDAADYQLGTVWCVHSPEEFQQIRDKYPSKLVVLMCKASHCRPCKMFGRKYSRMAERFSDSVLLEVIGDETNDTKKMMISMEVRVTPTFRMYRGAECVDVVTGTDDSKLSRAILKNLTPSEAGYLEERLEEAAGDGAAEGP